MGNKLGAATSTFQKSQKFKRWRRFRFERVTAAPDSGLAKSIMGRGLAVADFDGDGKSDVIISGTDSAPTLLRNVSDTKNNWLDIKLIGDVAKKTPRDAIGSQVFVTVGKLRQRYDVTSGGSYASQSSQIIHVGLGDSAKIDNLEVVWSNGQKEKILVNKVNTQIVVKQSN